MRPDELESRPHIQARLLDARGNLSAGAKKFILPYFQHQLFNNYLATWVFTWVSLANCVGANAFHKQIETSLANVRAQTRDMVDVEDQPPLGEEEVS